MSTSVTLPALGESVTEGTVTRWLKQEGDTVEADEPLLEVSTDKVDTEIPSPAAGTLLSIKVQEDETVEVGAELAVIGDSAEVGGSDQSAAGGGGEAPDAGESATDRSEGDTAEGATEAEPEQPEQPEVVADPTSDAGSAGDQSAGSSPEASADDAPVPAAETSGGSDSTAGSAGPSGSAGGVSVTLPALGESVTEGTVTRWLKQEGDTVEADEPLLEVSTDKVDTEIPSPVAGTLLSIKVQEDETAEVGAELAVIGTAASGSGDSDGEGEGTGGAADAGTSGDGGSAIGTDEQPAAAAEKAAAEKQEAAIEAGSSSTTPADERAADATPAGGAASSRSAVLAAQTPPAQTSAESSSGADSASSDGAYVTPLVRKLATEAGLELSSITGSGVGGRIRKQDILDASSARDAAAAEQVATADRAASQAAAAPAAAPAPAAPAAAATGATAASDGATGGGASASLRGQTVKMTRMRAFIAKRMVESLQVSAQLTTVVEVDVTQIARLRNRAKADFVEREGVKLSFLPFFAKASVEALRAYPQVNSSINGETNEVTYHGAEHLGIAVDTERGLIVPVIHDAGDLNIGGLARKIADLADRTRSNKVSPDELSGGTFTLTNTGSRGALFDTPILNQPQVGILGTGAVVKRPVVIDDPRLGETIVVRSMVYLALTYDHRIVDGADAARFLTSMKQRLEEGKFEADIGL